jgi:hypothetical protein
MTSKYLDDERFFAAIAKASNTNDGFLYAALLDCLDTDYRDRLPSTVMPWDDLSGNDIKELFDMSLDRTIVVDTGDPMQPKKELKVTGRNWRGLLSLKSWGKRLW